jgi:hypothetical protein
LIGENEVLSEDFDELVVRVIAKSLLVGADTFESSAAQKVTGSIMILL